MTSVQIKLEHFSRGGPATQGAVLIDGVDISNVVHSGTIEFGCERLTEVTLRLHADAEFTDETARVIFTDAGDLLGVASGLPPGKKAEIFEAAAKALREKEERKKT